MIFLLSSLVWADIFGLKLEQVRFDIEKGRYNKALKILKTLEKDAPKSDEILSSNELAAVWYLRGVIQHKKRDDVMDAWRQALVINPNYPWEDNLIRDPVMRDLFYAIQQEVLYRDTQTVFVPQEHGSAKIFIDGRRVYPAC